MTGQDTLPFTGENYVRGATSGLCMHVGLEVESV